MHTYPIASQWNFNLEFTCVNQEALFTTALATDVATGFLVLFLPVYKVCLFLMIYSVLSTLPEPIEIYTILDDFPRADTTWIYAPVFYWAIIETNVGVLSACLPTLCPLQERFLGSHPFIRLRKSFTNFLSSSNGKRSNLAGDIRLGSLEEEMQLNGKNIPVRVRYTV
ncbi:d13df1e8-b037-41a7-8638-858b8680bd96 [Sclerotinia trifoliorum]|uniref:D13df1e8-b037-41a7-8638-858b8680bd96 n=1 Tax=Sclerotinia trifoliorum TaxID=28548 RepID=A0A8H2ZPE5_9HELO|nr:d13df1e8-b037-41a7-8638-858b8680bd96 [Sclerotinia trifoliorum]